jgi:hypothetical protein
MSDGDGKEIVGPRKREISAVRNVAELLLGGLFFPAYALLSEPVLWRESQGLKFVLQFAGLWLVGILLAGVMRAWWWKRIGRKQAARRQQASEGKQ